MFVKGAIKSCTCTVISEVKDKLGNEAEMLLFKLIINESNANRGINAPINVKPHVGGGGGGHTQGNLTFSRMPELNSPPLGTL